MDNKTVELIIFAAFAFYETFVLVLVLVVRRKLIKEMPELTKVVKDMNKSYDLTAKLYRAITQKTADNERICTGIARNVEKFRILRNRNKN